MAASSKFPTWVDAVNKTAWLPGSTCGQRWVNSPGFNFVSGAHFPPDEGTRQSPVPPLPLSAATILPSSPQLAPSGSGASHSVTAAPP